MEDNLGAAEVKLTPEEMRGLDELTRPEAIYPTWFTERTADAKLKEALGPIG